METSDAASAGPGRTLTSAVPVSPEEARTDWWRPKDGRSQKTDNRKEKQHRWKRKKQRNKMMKPKEKNGKRL